MLVSQIYVLNACYTYRFFDGRAEPLESVLGKLTGLAGVPMSPDYDSGHATLGAPQTVHQHDVPKRHQSHVTRQTASLSLRGTQPEHPMR